MTRIRIALSSLLLALVTASSLLAQNSENYKVDVNLNTNGSGGFFTQPWVWIVGGAVFILLLVALLRSGGRKDD